MTDFAVVSWKRQKHFYWISNTHLVVDIRISYTGEVFLYRWTRAAVSHSALRNRCFQDVCEEKLCTRIVGFAVDGGVVVMGWWGGCNHISALHHPQYNCHLVHRSHLELVVHDAVKHIRELSHFHTFISSLISANEQVCLLLSRKIRRYG